MGCCRKYYKPEVSHEFKKLQFRSLVRKYDCDLCFTPMIIADSFVKSEKARNSEFTTNKTDKPLIVQFAASTPEDFSEAAELVAPYCNGVDLNCGCPQRWAMKLGIGAHLLLEPETIKNMVRSVKSKISDNFSVSVKMRLLNNVRDTVELCRQLEKTGADFITIHGRTKEQKNEPVNVEALLDITSSLSIPLVANGDVKNLAEVQRLQDATGCRGVMCARGLLQNPALFAGYSYTPVSCVRQWVELALATNLHFITFHHHLVFMLEKVMKKYQRRLFNNFTTYEEVLTFLNHYFNFDFDYSMAGTHKTESSIWEIRNPQGSYFESKIKEEEDLEDFLDDSVCLYS